MKTSRVRRDTVKAAQIHSCSRRAPHTTAATEGTVHSRKQPQAENNKPQLHSTSSAGAPGGRERPGRPRGLSHERACARAPLRHHSSTAQGLGAALPGCLLLDSGLLPPSTKSQRPLEVSWDDLQHKVNFSCCSLFPASGFFRQEFLMLLTRSL